MKLGQHLIANLLMVNKYYKYIIYSFLLVILYPQNVLSADDNIFKKWNRGGFTIEEYYNIHEETAKITFTNSAAVCDSIQVMQDIAAKKNRIIPHG